MAYIRLACGRCGSALQVRSELAGQQGRCPKCGAEIAITAAASDSPSTDVMPAAPADDASSGLTASPPLCQATAPDMLAEIYRRKKSAVLVVFETPADDCYHLSGKPESNVRCYRTADMSDSQLMEVLEHVGRMSQGKRNQKGGIGLQSGSPLPFEIKGDRLGMALDDFKKKYARRLGNIEMPYCSDSCPGQANPALWSEPWHASAGIVHGRVDLPSENGSPTLAGVKTEVMLYKFVDGCLYRITALFETEAFHIVRDALAQKMGFPTSETKEPVEITWDNGVSSLRLSRGMMRPKKPSALNLVHHLLQTTADSRIPKRGDDI